MVVAGHFNVIEYGGGGAFSLFMVAGFSFTAFTLPRVLETGRASTMLPLAVRIAVLTLAFMLVNYMVTGNGSVQAFLFIGNWYSPDTPGSAWFIEVYLQTLCILGLVLAIPSVRQALQLRRFSVVTGTAMGFVVIAAISDVVVDTNYLFHRIPHLMAWMFLVGAAANQAESNRERAVVTVIFLLGIWQFNGFVALNPVFFLVAALSLIWLASIPVPRLALVPLRTIAGASLLIYLTHFQFASLANKLGGQAPWQRGLAAVLGGILLWRIYQPIDQWVMRRMRR
jgi:hypothetical protein